MSRGKIKYRVGIDDRPLTRAEFTRLQAGGSLYCKIDAPVTHSGKKGKVGQRSMHTTFERRKNGDLELIQ